MLGLGLGLEGKALLPYKASGAYIILPQLKRCWSSIFFSQATLCNNCTVVTQHIVTIIQHLICIGGVHIDILGCVCYVISSGNNIWNTKTKRNNNNNNNSNKLHITLSDDSWLWGKYHHWIELKNSFPMVYSTITFV